MVQERLFIAFLSLSVLPGLTCAGEPVGRTAFVPPPAGKQCPTVFVSLAGLGESCSPPTLALRVPNPCAAGENLNAKTTFSPAETSPEKTLQHTDLEDGIWEFRSPRDSQGAYEDFCPPEPRFFQGTYKYYPEGEDGLELPGDITVLFSGVGGHSLEVESMGPTLALSGVSASPTAVAACTTGNRCAGLLGPYSWQNSRSTACGVSRATAPLRRRNSGSR